MWLTPIITAQRKVRQGDGELKSRLSQQNKTKFLNKQNSINDRDRGRQGGRGGRGGRRERDLALASIAFLERSQSITIMEILKMFENILMQSQLEFFYF